MASEEAEIQEPKFRVQAQMKNHPYHTKVVVRAYSFSSILIKLVNSKDEVYLEDRTDLELQIYDEERNMWVNCNNHLEKLTDTEHRKEMGKDLIAGKLGRSLWDMVT